MRRSNRFTLLTLVALLFVVSFVPGSIHTASASTQTATGLIVPLYSYPGSDWSNLVWAKQVNPNVPMVAIVNPSDGPGWYKDPNYVSGIDSLQSAGITVVGYVWTDYGARSVASAEADIAAYRDWYGVNGVYLDQMSNVPGYEWYYSTLNSYAKSIGMTLVVGNPGASVPSSYIGTVDTMVIYESPGAPSLASLAAYAGAGKSNFAMVAYDVQSLDVAYAQAAAKDLGYIYLTNGVWPNPYSPESSYLDGLAATLAAADSGSSSQGTAGTISVTTIDRNGNEVWGLYTTLWHEGSKVQSCFSPCTFSVNGGETYQVAVSNYGSFVFAQWGDGTLSNIYSVTEPSSATTLSLWAEYNT
ncbi:MAG: spherulation-specific family 4 protein [Thaumarchaeota archaeon]|nr:spherulation-specific family 4 protein [Nitrososphaerota archaeon]